MIFNTCFACSDCDGELPASFGFVLLDFKVGLGRSVGCALGALARVDAGREPLLC